MVVFVVGCQSTTTLGINTDLEAVHCAGWQIIRPSRADTEGTLSQVLAHNDYLRQMCKNKQLRE